MEYINGTKIESKANKYTFVWRKTVEKKRTKLMEHANHLDILGKRNTCSKTDPDATFMRMKKDAMKNGLTKSGYNLQTGTEYPLVIDFRLFSSLTDTLFLIPFFHSFLHRYNRLPTISITNFSYGSEENYQFMIEAFVKYNYFYKEHRPRYIPTRSMQKVSITTQKRIITFIR